MSAPGSVLEVEKLLLEVREDNRTLREQSARILAELATVQTLLVQFIEVMVPRKPLDPLEASHQVFERSVRARGGM
jgi:hypothetical protein